MRAELALCALLALAAVACSDDPAAADTADAADLCAGSGAAVTVTAADNYTFTPSAVTISAGQSVCWKNTGNLVHILGANGLPDFNNVISSMPGGQTFVYTYTAAGSYSYYCRNHSTMRGTVIVN